MLKVGGTVAKGFCCGLYLGEGCLFVEVHNCWDYELLAIELDGIGDVCFEGRGGRGAERFL